MKSHSRASVSSLILIGVSTLGTPIIVSAQSASVDDGTSLAEVVVTATKRSENTVDVPIAITAVSGAGLAAAQIQNVSDLTTLIPGLNYTGGPAARPNLRGISSQSSAAGAENNLAIYIDGIYQADIYGNTFDLPDVQNVEVLKGPQGTLFGRNASGGAILVSSLNPSFTPTGHIEVSDGRYAGGDRGGVDARVSGFYSAPVNDQLALSVAALYGNSDGFAHDDLRGGRTGKIVSEFIRTKALYKPTDNAEILVTAYYSKREDNSVYNEQNLNPLKTVPALTPSQPWHVANDAAGYFVVERYGTSIKGTLNLDAGTITSLSGLSVTKPTIVADADGSSAPLQIYVLGQPNRTLSQEFDFASSRFGAFSFVSGIFIYNSVERFTPLQVDASLEGPVYFTDYAKSTDKAYAVFTEANYDITSRLNFVAGIRYSYEDRVYQGATTDEDPLPTIGHAHFDAYTPRFSLKFKIADQTNAYFTYSKGFKSGLFDTSSFSPAVIQPETLKAYELGIKSNPIPSLQVSASVYHYDVSNLQVQTNTANGLAALSNAGAAEIDGGEFDVSWRALKTLTLSGGASYIPTAHYRDYPDAPIVAPNLVDGGGFNATINASGMRPDQTPRFQGNLQARYEDDYSFGKLGGDITGFHSSGFPFELSGFLYQRSYTLVNATASVNPNFSPNSKFTLWGKNLTNTAVIGSVLTSAVAFSASYMAPREIGLSYGYSF